MRLLFGTNVIKMVVETKPSLMIQMPIQRFMILLQKHGQKDLHHQMQWALEGAQLNWETVLYY